ncbi:MAG: zinc ABC transporter substrate-binding protein [Thaumarchaeota archaeon]|nr:zinc ABC transporter substrate-binding protein [Nitrososphaerota archaeon]
MLLPRWGLPILLIILLLANGLAAAAAAEEKPLVVATTSVLGSVVEDLAGDRVQVIVLVNPSICPAHYDVKPSDLYAVSKAKLIFYHGIEEWLMQLYNASESKARLVKVSGGWSTINEAKSYYQQVAEALESELGLDVSEKLGERLSELDRVADEILGEAEKESTSSINVIVMKWQRSFVEWLGFNVVGDFGPPERLSSSDIEKLISLGKEKNVAIVISNLQSGTDVGEAIAREIGAVHVVLSNFPGSSPETKSLADLIEGNAEKVFKAISLYQLKRTVMEMRDEVEFYRVGFYALLVVAVVEAAGIVYLARRLKAIG